MSETNHVSSRSTLALAEHCKNLKMYVLHMHIHVRLLLMLACFPPRAKFESCVKLDGDGLVQVLS